MTVQGTKSQKTGKGRGLAAILAASLLVSGLGLTGHSIAFAQDRDGARAAPPLESRTRFTPARGDKRLAASLARERTSDRKFSFTPAGSERKRDNLRVAVRADSNRQGARAAASPEVRPVAGHPAALRLTPNSYNLGVDVGWKRFGVSGNVEQERSNVPALADRDRAQVGVSYNRESFSGRVAVSGERNPSAAPVLAPRESYSLDVGGKINISKHIAVTGGVRYRIDQDRVDPDLEDNRRDSQAVYVGTKVRF
ncbi:hypothetical protein [Sphingomicrobium clamense]|uniref:Porin domain-containing protein n=1 Tax=Sphingomicrobium clamense TaxID=2851013 RepID=A0ABS6V341_9SPHN|nr:hypothetical protein [Sphingomicrobium sp. B8]MBW0143949.1 hypothetical protein [Sphingomicrobium sp. B8]